MIDASFSFRFAHRFEHLYQNSILRELLNFLGQCIGYSPVSCPEIAVVLGITPFEVVCSVVFDVLVYVIHLWKIVWI